MTLSSLMLAAYEHCEAEVRAADKDRYLATLFAPGASTCHGRRLDDVHDKSALPPIAAELVHRNN